MIIHENQYTIVKEVMIYDTLVKSSQLRFFCVYIYNVIFIHTYVQLRIYLSIPSHPILSFSERYPVIGLCCQSCNTNQVPRPSRFKLFSVFADTFVQSARRMLAQRESKIRFRYLDKPASIISFCEHGDPPE